MPRVAFLGNIANVHYRIARALRERTAVEAHLFVNTGDPPAWRPETDDPDLATALPDWIHDGRWLTPRALLSPARAAITRELRAYDLVVASGVGPMFAQHTGRPWCFFATGADLTVKPFPLTFWNWSPSWARRLGHQLAGVSQRRALRRADTVVLQPYAHLLEAADRIGIDPARRSGGYFPLPIDPESLDFAPEPRVGDRVEELVGDADFVVFHPCRLVMDDHARMRRTGQWKGNDRLIEGFAAFVASGRARQPALVLVDRPGGGSIDHAKQLIADLALDDCVRWARPAAGGTLDRLDMAALYRRADVVASEFGVGWFGYVALEGAAAGRPVLTHVNEAVMAQLYPWHPFVSVETGDEIETALGELCDRPTWRGELGERGREWIDTFHAPEAVAERYADELTRLMGELVVA